MTDGKPKRGRDVVRLRAVRGRGEDLAPTVRPGDGDVRGAVIIGLLCVWDGVSMIGAMAMTDALARDAVGAATGVALVVLAVLILSAAGAYRPHSWLREHPIEMMGALTAAASGLAWAGVVLGVTLGGRTHSGRLILAWLLLPLGWYVGRRVAAVAWRRRRPEQVLIVGGGEVAGRVHALAKRSGASVIGCLEEGPGSISGVPVLGEIEDLPRILAEREVDRLVVAFSTRRDHETLRVLRNCTSFRGAVDIVPRFFDFLAPNATLYSTDGLPMLSLPPRRLTRGRAIVKRTIDLAGGLLLLIVLSPLLLAISLAIMVDGGRPILFRQRRIGMHGRPFSIFKFRTLEPVGEEPELPPLELSPISIARHVERAKREAASRATRVGAILRRTSLDELPQLFNVLLGHMSLVGPRPLNQLEDATLEGWEVLRREVRPGITGLWQVSGRSEVSWEERIGLDYRQVRHWSLYSDMQVLADTVGAVLRQRGAE